MSLIADSLKKAQTEREQEAGRLAETVLRVSGETLTRFPKSLLAAVAAVPVVFLGIWFVLLPGLSEKSVVTQTAGVSTHTVVASIQEASLDMTTPDVNEEEVLVPSIEVETKEPVSGTQLSEIQNKPLHPVETTVGPVEETPGLESVPATQQMVPVETVKAVPVEEPVLASSETLGNPKPVEIPVEKPKETIEPVVASVVEQGPPTTEEPVTLTAPIDKESTHADEKTVVDQKEEKETPIEPEPVETPPVKVVIPENQPQMVFVPFTKPQSPLEIVASLTKGVQQEPVPVEAPLVQNPVTPTETITFENENNNETVEVLVTPEAPSSGTSDQQMAKLDTESAKSGDITVIPDQDFMDSLTNSSALGVDKRAMNEKTRYFNIAVFHHKKKDYFEALKYYDKAAKLDPGNAQIFNNRALVFQKLGRREAAIEELMRAIHIDSRYVKAYNNLGLLYYYSGNYLAAIKSFEKAVEIDPRNVESFNNLAILYKQQKQYAQAKNLYRKVILLAPDQAEAHYNLALLYEETGELSSAIKHYQHFVETGSKSRPTLAIQVRSHIKKLQELSHS